MSITLVENREIDRVKWDECIRLSKNAVIYANYDYLSIVSPGWDALIEDDYKSVFPLTYRKKYGIKYMLQPYFCQQSGLFSIDDFDNDKLLSFIEHIPSDIKLIKYNLNEGNSCSGKRFIKNINIKVYLQKSYEDIKNKYNSNCKRNIAKAINNNIISEELNEAEPVIELFKKTKGREVKKINKINYEPLENICKNFNVKINSVKHNEEICAGVIFVETYNGYILLISAANDYGKNSGAVYFMINDFIKENAGKIKFLDFEGSNNKNLLQFYKGFGGVEKYYFTYQRNNLPLHIKLGKKLKDLF